MTVELFSMGAAAGVFSDATAPEQPQDVRYTYWPVHYPGGDPTVVGTQSLPLSGVQFSVQGRGVGELRASLQLADENVRAIDPWSLIIPRRTGIVVVRSVTNPLGQENHEAVAHYVVWTAPVDPETGRMNIIAQTVESLWARRRISGPPPVGHRDAEGELLPGMDWTNADQAQIIRDLLDPDEFSQFGLIGGSYPAWITVEAPVENMGVLRTHSYRRGQNTNLLTAHQDRSKIINGYEWYTAVRVLVGANAHDAESFRLQFVWGYPRLGREFGTEDVIPRFSYYVDGRGNVLRIEPVHDGTSVSSVMWGTGSGFDDETVRTVAWNSLDWGNGFLMTEEEYSNPDVSVLTTLQEQTEARLIQSYANEKFLKGLTVRGDLQPHFSTYALYDDCLVTTDDWTWPDNLDGSRGVTYLSRILGWTVTPPEGEQAEHVKLLLLGDDLQDETGDG